MKSDFPFSCPQEPSSGLHPEEDKVSKHFLTNSVAPEPEGSAPHLQQPATGPYLEQV
jgi:hypothetical protein